MRKGLLVFVVIAFFIVAAVAGSLNIYLKSKSSNDFCAGCHKETYETYMSATETEGGRSIAKIHRDEGLVCWDCHADSAGAFLREELDMYLRSYLDYPANVSLPKVRDRCVDCHVWDLPVHAVKSDEIHKEGANCSECHPGYENGTVRTTIQPHEDVETCGGCHYVHRSVLKIGDFMQRNCSECHDLPTLSGGHKGIQCSACHLRHALIPNCTLCHSSHTGEAMYNEGCKVCHESAHQPTEAIDYPANTSKEVCSGCHSEQVQTLEMYNEAHNYAVTDDYNLLESCTGCHPKHQQTIRCMNSSCHGNRVHYEYHPYNDCGECHGTPKKKCVSCHKSPHAPRASLDW